MKIPVTSSTIRRREMDAVLSCMVSEKIGPGELNLRLQQQVKDSFGAAGCAALRSPAIALEYALKALELPAEAGIMISALAPDWQYTVIKKAGYNPVVLDVSQETALVTSESIENGIKRGGRLILPHEICGMLPDFEMINSFGLPVIEDVSQSAGSYVCLHEEGQEPEEKKAGTFGVFSIIGLEEQDILTAGGGAVLMAAGRRDWTVLKKLIDEAPVTDILPDINCALGLVQLKERERNEQIRGEMKTMYTHALMQGKHKTFVTGGENAVPAVYSFPVVLTDGLKDVVSYAARKEIEVVPAFANTVIAKYAEEFSACKNAKSLLMRCVLFPLYPRLGTAQAEKISKVLRTLP